MLQYYGVVENDGFAVGTFYPRILMKGSYDPPEEFIADTDKIVDLRTSLREVDLDPGERRKFFIDLELPKFLTKADVLISKLEIWNPHRLYGGPTPHLFDRSIWLQGPEIVASTSSEKTVFFSYSHDSEEHKKWVLDLAQNVKRFGFEVIIDQLHLFAGDDAIHFMERNVWQSDFVILICTDKFNNKADERSPSGVGSETILTADKFHSATPEDRSKVIAVVRNCKSERKTPRYLGSSVYVDMSDGSDQRQKLIDLRRSMERH